MLSLQEKYWINRSWFAKPWLSTEAIIGYSLMAVIILPYVSVIASIDDISTVKSVISDLASNRVMSLIGSSLLLSLFVAIGSTGLGFILAACVIFSKSVLFTRSLLIAGGLTYSVSPVVLLSAWQAIPWTQGIAPLWSSVAVFTWSYFPISLLVILLAIRNMEPSGLECARLASRSYQIIRFIVLPQLKQPVLISACIVFLFVFMQSEVPSLLSYPVYAEEFMARLILEDTLGSAVVLALPMMMVTLLILPVLVWNGKLLLSISWKTNGIKVLQEILQAVSLLGVLSLFILLVLAIPMLILFLGSGFTDFISANGRAILSSLALAIPSSLIAIVLAHLVVEGIVALRGIGRATYIGLIVFQILMPGALLGLGMISLSHWPGMRWLNTQDLLLIITHALRILPFLLLFLLGLRWRQSSERVREFTMMEVGWLRRQLHIRLPEERFGLFIAGALGFVLVLSELSTTVLVIAPGTETAILRLYNLMHYGDWPTVSALALAQALMVIAIILAISFVGINSRDKG